MLTLYRRYGPNCYQILTKCKKYLSESSYAHFDSKFR